jgi:transcriptional regulator with XRE-family HTH domain
MAKIVPFVLKRLRKANGLSQEELAQKARIDKQTIFRLEREGGHAKTRPLTIQRVARALNTEPDVLTGEAPVPDTTEHPMSGMARFSFLTSNDAHNALFLVSKRYHVPQQAVVELAPFLFCCAAEASLRQRRERLRRAQLSYENAKTAHEAISYLSGPDLSSPNEELEAEKASIDYRDLFGLLLEDYGSPAGDETQNPFALYLADLANQTDGVAEFDGYSSMDWPEYRVCADEVEHMAGGDSDLAEHVHEGRIPLNDMPRNIRDRIDPKEQTEWLRAKRDEYLKWLNPHLYEQDTSEEPSA